ncbi:metallophosphoesterase, partial [Desulfovibrio sp. OttesenSCG-928-C06]|nr:metallophosphoesterase [Desulfovibrio sp. OttesenSCG-928-C06]
VRVNIVQIATAKLPHGVERVRVLQLSDIHLSDSIGPAELRKIEAKVRELRPDIIAVTGDLVDTNMAKRTEDAKILRELPATHGKYAVMGNHEYYRGLDNSRKFMRESGLEILENRAVLDKSGIIVAGIDDPVMPRNPQAPANTVKLLKRQEQGRFVLLLKHRPYVEQNEIGLFDLQLSGHTHGGQIWPGTMFAKRANRDVEQGLSELAAKAGRSLLYVSNGVGYWGPPMRFMAPPEITVFDLVRAN